VGIKNGPTAQVMEGRGHGWTVWGGSIKKANKPQLTQLRNRSSKNGKNRLSKSAKQTGIEGKWGGRVVSTKKARPFTPNQVNEVKLGGWKDGWGGFEENKRKKHTG